MIHQIMKQITQGIEVARANGIECSYPYTVTINGITYVFQITR